MFVDWHSAMESELLMTSNVGLLPFNAITINYQYVGLCIPGVGEKKYLEMARVLYVLVTRQCLMRLMQSKMHSKTTLAEYAMDTS